MAGPRDTRNLKPESFKEVISLPYIPMGLILAGILLRLFRYLRNEFLWRDEASLALNLIERDYSQLFEPLSYGQAAPVGFLIVAKSIVDLFGYSEYSFRFFPLLLGMLSLPLIYSVSNKLISRTGAILCLALLAVSPTAIQYSAEFKQYYMDLFITLLILKFGIDTYRSNYSLKSCLTLAAVGCLGMWFSHPAVFVLAGLGAALMVDGYFKYHISPMTLPRIMVVMGVWLGNFSILYFLFIKQTAEPHFYEFWRNAFPPIWHFPVRGLLWYPHNWIDIVVDLLGLVPARAPRVIQIIFSGLALMILLVGMKSLSSAKSKRIVLYITIFPLIIVFIASCVRIYPFSSRLLLFTLPLFYISISEGAVRLFSVVSRNTVLSLPFIIVLCLSPILGGIHTALIKNRLDDIRPAIRYYMKNKQTGDSLFLFHFSQRSFDYYTYPASLSYYTIFPGKASPPPKVIPQLEPRFGYVTETELFNFKRVAGKRRAWILFSRDFRKNKRNLTHRFNQSANRLDYFESEYSSLYLYDFSNVPQ